MPYVVNLPGYRPPARYDGLPWTKATIGESASSSGPFSTIATITFGSGGQPPADTDPTQPQVRDLTTAAATLPSGWYLITWVDAASDMSPITPVPYPPPEPQASTPYCSVLDVQNRNAARPVTPSSVPNIAQVQQFVLDAAAEINAILVNKGYAIPVNSASSPDAFAVLHSANVTGGWAMMEQAAPNSPNLDRAQTAWDAAKKMLADAAFVLNAPQDVARSEARGPWVTAFPSGETFDPTFRFRDGQGGNDPKLPYFSRQQQF